MIVDVGVTNPVPGMSTVAVAPFINLSNERAVDGRQFAQVYFTELQKVPGYEVLPIGVTEAAIVENRLSLNSPDDVLKLARILHVDAVVVGAITEYAPYYPPRIGYQIEWYSPYPAAFYPGIQIEPQTREQFKDWDEEQVKEWRRRQKERDEERKHEYHIWHRAWWQIKRLPGVRKLAGEPTLVQHDNSPMAVFRAQSMEELPRVMTNQEADLSSREWQPENARIGWIERPGDVLRAENRPSTNPYRIVTSRRLIEPSLPLGASLSAPTEELSGDGTPIQLAEPSSMESPPHGTEASLSDTPSSVPVEVFPEPVISPTPSAPQQAPAEADPASPKIVPGPAAVPQLNSPRVADPKETEPEHAHEPTPAPVLAPAELPPPMLPVRDPKLAPLPPQPNPYNVTQPVQPWQLDPRLPFMSYTRMFDGSDADLVAALRDYVELSGDLRSGGWEAYLHRSEDFIRFTSHMVISEMLSLHGGEGRHRFILKNRKYK